MTSLLDLWKLNLDQINLILNRFNLTDAKTPVGKYILLTEYYASRGFFSPEERKDLLSTNFRNELLNPNMNMDYEERVQYIKNYLEARKIRTEQCKYAEIKEGKLIDAVTIDPIEDSPVILNNRCYSRSTIESIVRSDKKDPLIKKQISDEIINMSNFKRINTIGDGSCLIHAIMMAYYPDYKILSFYEKNQVAHKFRADFASFLCQESILSTEYISLKLNMGQSTDIASLYFFINENGNLRAATFEAQEITDRFYKIVDIDESIKYVIDAFSIFVNIKGEYYTDNDILEILFLDPRQNFIKKHGPEQNDLLQLDLPINCNYFAYSTVLPIFEDQKLDQLVSISLDYNKFLGNEDILPFICQILGITIVVFKDNYKSPHIFEPNIKSGHGILVYNLNETHWELMGQLFDGNISTIFHNSMIERSDDQYRELSKYLLQLELVNL